MAGALEVRVLGPLEVRRHGLPVVISGTKPRAVLSLLGLYSGRTIPGSTLIEVLWGDDPPRTAAKALQTHVSALRRALGDGVVLTTGSGWTLADADTDAERFDRALTAGRDAAHAGDPDAAAGAFTAALALWRGAPELPETDRARSEVARWTEQHDTVAEDRFDALLARGDGPKLIGELEAEVAAAPLRERRWAQLMLALYRAGRQADALAAYQRARTVLDDQLGVEPGPDLRGLEGAILQQDPALSPVLAPRMPQPAPPQPRASLDRAGRLPVQRTTFVGRADELRKLDELLRAQSLITVTGPGGVGKTRLAIAAAESATDRFRAGVVFIDLVPVRAQFVAPAIAAALGITELPNTALVDLITQHLSGGRWLIVLDNCEHVLEPAAEIAERIIAACPDVAVVATSRERLGARGERVVKVPGLELRSPETGRDTDSDAVALFFQRSREVEPEFDADPRLAAGVCASLDGLPLAIELAAARSASMGIDGVLAGLEDRMRLLMGARGTVTRHRSLRAVVGWSHDLLDDAERAAFRRLSLFAGGFDLAAAVAVVADSDGSTAEIADVIGRLADKNLLAHRPGPSGSRWRLLETIRAFAREQLSASGEEPLIRARHLRWAAATAGTLHQRLDRAEPWREGFDTVVDDLRQAVAADAPDQQDDRYRLAHALAVLTYACSYLAEAQRHFQQAATLTTGGHAARELHAAAGVAFARMRSDLAFDLLLQAADTAAAAGDPAAEAVTLSSAVVLGARCPGSFAESPSPGHLAGLLTRARAAADDSPRVNAYLAAATAWTACPVRARCDGPLGEVALEAARRVGDPVLISAALDGVTTAALGAGRFRQAAMIAGGRVDLIDRFLRHDSRSGGEISDIYHMATETAIAAGDLPAALATATRSAADPLGIGVPMLAPSRLTLVHALRGAFPESLAQARAMSDAWQRVDRPVVSWMAPAAYAAALVSGLRGDDAGRVQWSELAVDLTTDRTVQGFAPFVDCRIALYRDRLSDAVRIAEQLPPEYLGKFDAYARTIAAEAAVVAQTPGAARLLDAAAVLAEENDWAAACVLRARGRLTGDQELLDRAVSGWERVDAVFERACTLLLIDDRADEGRADLAELGCPVPAGVR